MGSNLGADLGRRERAVEPGRPQGGGAAAAAIGRRTWRSAEDSSRRAAEGERVFLGRKKRAGTKQAENQVCLVLAVVRALYGSYEVMGFRQAPKRTAWNIIF